MPHDPPTDRIRVCVDSDLRSLVPTFLQHRHEEIPLLQSALAQSDYETIKQVGHTIKGVGGGYGFDELTPIGSRLELAALEKNSQNIQKGIQELVSYLAHVDVVYE